MLSKRKAFELQHLRDTTKWRSQRRKSPAASESRFSQGEDTKHITTSSSDNHPTAHRRPGLGPFVSLLRNGILQQVPRAEATNKNTTENKSRLKPSAMASLHRRVDEWRAIVPADAGWRRSSSPRPIFAAGHWGVARGSPRPSPSPRRPPRLK